MNPAYDFGGSTEIGSTKKGSTKKGSTKSQPSHAERIAARKSTKKGSTKKGSTKKGSTKRRIGVGSRVLVQGYDCAGTVRYAGPHKAGHTGERFLVELDEPLGKNDGTVKGVKYCDALPDQTGVLAKPEIVSAYN